jgi:hypothetical protein
MVFEAQQKFFCLIQNSLAGGDLSNIRYRYRNAEPADSLRV